MYYCKNKYKSSIIWKKNAKEDFFFHLESNELTRQEILDLAAKTHFMKRKPKKVDPYYFLVTVCTLAVLDTPSFSSIASNYAVAHDAIISKQAISKKMKTDCLEFFKSILSLTIHNKLQKTEVNTMPLLEEYQRVLVQDSTIIQLPLRLFDSFSGAKNGVARGCNARIQGIYDLRSGCFVEFSIDSFSKNDLLAAPELDICKNDLTLRDRGYFTIDEVERHIQAGAHCIFRFKAGTGIRCPKTGDKLDIVKLLKKSKKNKILDKQVCLNNKQRSTVRLLAVPVSEEIANKRRAEAKKKTNRKKQPSQEVLQLMDWSIFITTIPAEVACFDKIFAIYSLRWRIEIIFKAWKSHAAFSEIHNVSETHLRILLTARFLMIVIFVNYVYSPWSQIIRSKYKREVSLLKLFCYITNNMEQLNVLLQPFKRRNQENMAAYLIKYCTYDKRKRKNFNQILMTHEFLS